MASIKDIANLSGFSIATVSRYLNGIGTVGEDAQKAIDEAIKKVGYQPNYIARSLVKQKTNVIGVIVPSLSLSFLASFVEGVEKTAARLGYAIFLCNCDEDVDTEAENLKLLQTRRVDGIIAIPVGAEPDVYSDVAAKIPLVLAVRKIEGADLSSIVVDDFDGAYKVVSYLVGKGHHEVAFINGPVTLSTGRLRWKGACQAMEDGGFEPDSDLVRFCPFTVHDGYEAAKDILRGNHKPTAFFAANQILCIGVMHALSEAGLKIPDDISLVSFDGFEGCYAEYLVKPGITSNFNPVFNIGEMAAELVAEEINIFKKKEGSKINYFSTRHLCIKMEFKERESVKEISDNRSDEE
jgi:LacI family transcriptional regulator